MSWEYTKLGVVAPSKASTKPISGNELWHLTLDQLESHSGQIIEKKIIDPTGRPPSTNLFDNGNVLYSKLRPYLNKVHVPVCSGLATSELVPLRPNPQKLDRSFLSYFLRSQKFLSFATACVAGAKMPRMVMRRFWDYEIPVPHLKEQARIVELLDQADALRKLRTQADEKAARILPALFHHYFGDPQNNSKGFQKSPLGDLIKVRSGNGLTAKNMNTNGGIPVYGGNGINGYHDEFMFEYPQISIGRVGAYCGAVHITEERSWITDNALFVREYSDTLVLRYLADALHFLDLNRYAGRAGQPLISGNRIYPIEMLVPPISLQQDYANCAKQLTTTIKDTSISKQKLEDLFQLLLHRAFNGELTAQWREDYMSELVEEMAIQSKS